MSTGHIVLRLVVQPSANSHIGVRLWPPVVGILSSGSSTDTTHILSQIFAVATIIDESSGRAYRTLEGTYSDSPHPLGDDALNGIAQRQRNVAYVYFPNLIISTPGRYIIRVSLAQRTDTPNNGAYEYISTVDTRAVTVTQGAGEIFNPTPEEEAWLRVIQEDG
ncbi:hypothetical protein F5884DRAFT_680763 [Xylogone sp. PMI_703]|nr:hypothetical protein F5884DRAFT_680763 [Xylogone sp. PMI_703]